MSLAAQDRNKLGPILMLAGAILVIIGSALKAFSVTVSFPGVPSQSESITYLDADDGKVAVFLAVVVIGLAIGAMRGSTRKSRKVTSIIGLILSGLVLAFAIIDYSDTASVEQEILGAVPTLPPGLDLGVEVKVELGLYIVMVAAAIAVVGAILSLRSLGSADVTAGAAGMATPPPAWNPPEAAAPPASASPPASAPPPGAAPPPGQPPAGPPG